MAAMPKMMGNWAGIAVVSCYGVRRATRRLSPLHPHNSHGERGGLTFEHPIAHPHLRANRGGAPRPQDAPVGQLHGGYPTRYRLHGADEQGRVGKYRLELLVEVIHGLPPLWSGTRQSCPACSCPPAYGRLPPHRARPNLHGMRRPAGGGEYFHQASSCGGRSVKIVFGNERASKIVPCIRRCTNRRALERLSHARSSRRLSAYRCWWCLPARR